MKQHGLLLVDKPAGPTSHDVVEVARRALRERRIGHTGTLDPPATGLLLLCVGKATRLQQFLLAWEKTYVGEIRLGFATNTYDAEGEPLSPPKPAPQLTEDQLSDLAARFSGTLTQYPPPFSAKKKEGRKFYELARAGEEVPREPKLVQVHHLRLAFHPPDRLTFQVTCSSGTYVRSLAHDVGQVLGCGAHLATLRRVRIGPWAVESAIAAEGLAQRPPELPPGCFVTLHQVQLPFPTVVLNPTACSHFTHGQEVVVRDAAGEFVPGGFVTVRNRAGELVGVGATVAYMARARLLTLAPRMVLGGVEPGAATC